MTFNKFVKSIRALGGVWAGDHVYFTKSATSYMATYGPRYPENDPDNSVITCRYVDGFWSGSGRYAKRIPFIIEQAKNEMEEKA